MTNEPKPEVTYKFEKSNMSKKDFIDSILIKLHAIYALIEYTEKSAEIPSEGKFNFCDGGIVGLVRMIFPLIEIVSFRKPQKLLSTLNIQYPYIVWAAFRDGLIHNNWFISLEYKRRGDTYCAKAFFILGDNTNNTPYKYQHFIGKTIMENQNTYITDIQISIWQLLDNFRDYLKAELKIAYGDIKITERL